MTDVNLVRDQATGRSRGFAFVGYRDQRSTVLAVDNLTGATLLGRTLRCDHVPSYRIPGRRRRARGGDASSSNSEHELYTGMFYFVSMSLYVCVTCRMCVTCRIYVYFLGRVSLLRMRPTDCFLIHTASFLSTRAASSYAFV